jgi:dethiobiotin synthetase
MTRRFVVTGTDTDIGKTVFCAAMMLGLENAHYWKPLQSGVTDGVDTRTVQTLTGLPAERFFPKRIFSASLFRRTGRRRLMPSRLRWSGWRCGTFLCAMDL